MRTSVIAAGMAAGFFAAMLFSSGAEAACPIGSFPSVDNFGNQICKGFGSGDTRTLQGTTNQCPPGTHFDVDTYGNKVCKSFSNGQEFHDTSKGCPIGSFPSVDKYGNKVCKRF